jgi:aerobic carbon-monoxide dehydrogenase medium subunit
VLQPFQLYEPTTVREASTILDGLGDDGRIYAGGTELLLAMKQGLLRYGHLVNIKPIGLSGITFDPAASRLRIGATATHRAVERSAIVGTHAPLLVAMEHHLANVRVRAVGTVGGNLCFAEPHSDLAAVLLVYDAALRIGGGSGERTIGIAELFVDAYTTCLRPDELLLGIDVPPLPPASGAAYHKAAFFERPSAGVGAAILAAPDRTTVTHARIAVGCVDAVARRIPEAEAALAGVPLTGRAFDAAVHAAMNETTRACHPVEDLYGSPEYKRHLVGVLTGRSLRAARDQAMAGGER